MELISRAGKLGEDAPAGWSRRRRQQDETGRVGSGRLLQQRDAESEWTRVQDGETMGVERNRRPHSASFTHLSIPQASDNSPEDRTPEPLPPPWDRPSE